ncbi:MAG: Panacea domain-containing protein [Brevundimonas sp.]
MISAAKAANIVLDEAARYGHVLTPLQVMKHVYMSHGMFLGRHGAPLVPDHIQAWQYGPVISSLYGAMKKFGGGPVTEKLPVVVFDRAEPTEAERQAIQGVYATYGQFSGPALSNLTHRPGSPWSKVWQPGVSNLVIPNDLIRQHYADAIAQNVLASA